MKIKIIVAIFADSYLFEVKIFLSMDFTMFFKRTETFSPPKGHHNNCFLSLEWTGALDKKDL